MKRYYLLILTLVTSFSLSACTNPYQTGYELKTTEAETERSLDDNFGEGLSFSYVDFADNVLSLKYSLNKDSIGDWYLSINGENALFTGTRYIDNYTADQFFLFLATDSVIKGYKDYNEKDNYVKTDVIWWFDLKATFSKDNINAYGYLMHPNNYDDFRIKLTEYLNNMFKNAGEKPTEESTERVTFSH